MLEQTFWIQSVMKEWWLVGMIYEGIREIEKRLTKAVESKVKWRNAGVLLDNWVCEVANFWDFHLR